MKNSRNILYLACVTFLGLFGFWLVIALQGLQGESDQAEIFSAVYGIMALFGGLVGLRVSHKWGGLKSTLGRSVGFMSLGLLAQEVGQVAYSAYTYLFNLEIPYPSLGDVGFFGSVVCYILASASLISMLNMKNRLRSLWAKFWIFVVPLVLLVASYYIFLRSYQYDFHNPITVFLDLGYPLGQALYISLALLAFILSQKYLGGVMKPVVLSLIFALLLQYLADFTFLYQVNQETWVTGGWNELLYLFSYFVMTLSLIRFNDILHYLNKETRSDA